MINDKLDDVENVQSLSTALYFTLFPILSYNKQHDYMSLCTRYACTVVTYVTYF